MTTNAENAALWMKDAIDTNGVLYQDVAVFEIDSLFGKESTYINKNGNMAIAKDVLSKFRALTGDSIVWEKGSRLWRKRESNDMPSRRQY